MKFLALLNLKISKLNQYKISFSVKFNFILVRQTYNCTLIIALHKISLLQCRAHAASSWPRVHVSRVAGEHTTNLIGLNGLIQFERVFSALTQPCNAFAYSMSCTTPLEIIIGN